MAPRGSSRSPRTSSKGKDSRGSLRKSPVAGEMKEESVDEEGAVVAGAGRVEAEGICWEEEEEEEGLLRASAETMEEEEGSARALAAGAVTAARLKKSSKDDSTSWGSSKYSEMQALNPSSISIIGTISSRSSVSLEGEMGGVGMVRPNFFHTASDGVVKSTFSKSASSEQSCPPCMTSTDSAFVCMAADEDAGAAERLASDAKSVSDTVDEALEAKAELGSEDEEEEEEERGELELESCGSSELAGLAAERSWWLLWLAPSS